MRDSHADVLILGAGAAGLAAAGRLRGAGLTVLLLEARDHPGGRLFTLEGPGVPIEAGAEFVHGDADPLRSVLRSAGLAIAEVDGAQMEARDGAIHLAGERWAEMNGFFEALAGEPGSVADFLDRPETQSRFSPEARELVISYIEGFHAADIRRASARGIARAEQAGSATDGSANHRLLAGYSTLVDALTAPLRDRIRLGAVVTDVQWSRGRVEVRARERPGALVRSYEAERAIITLPLGVLQAPAGAEGAVRFDPPLPEATRRAIEGLAMGPVVKVALAFPEPLLAAAGDPVFLHVPGGPFNVFWTLAPMQAPVLVGWAAGPKGLSVSGRGERAIAAEAIRTLARALDRDPAELDAQCEARWVFDWALDPYTRGAYAFVAVGGEGAAERLAEPVEEALFFAGEALSGAAIGTVHGALKSGYRAAEAVLGGERRGQ